MSGRDDDTTISSGIRLRNNPNYGFYRETPKNTQPPKQQSDAYYGVNGVKKMPNFTIIMMCFGIALFGIILQVIVIRESYFIHRKKIRDTSIKLEEELERVQTSAQGKSNEMQTRILLEKIVAAAKTSTATASLGQALADEKK